MPDHVVVRARDITKTYGDGVEVHALRGISLEVTEGEMVAIMGPSGSGKTTLLNIVGCVDRPTGGSYWLDGQDVSRLSDRALSRIRNEKIGFVFQTFNLLPRMSAIQNVALPLVYSRRRYPRGAARRALERVGLLRRARHRPVQLSGGEQQRVAIARALVNEPVLVLADEPTGNLDPDLSLEIMRLFREINAHGATIVVATHDPALIRSFGRKVIHLEAGRVREQPSSHAPAAAREGLAHAGGAGRLPLGDPAAAWEPGARPDR